MNRLLLYVFFFFISLTNMSAKSADILLTCSKENQLCLSINYKKEGKDAEENAEERSPMDMEYYKWRIAHTKELFEWQLTSSIILFFLIIFIVLFGLYLSYLQLKKTINYKENNKENNLDVNVKISKEIFEISTSVIGLVILIISLLFLYLYLEKIYPIQGEDFFQILPKSDKTSNQ